MACGLESVPRGVVMKILVTGHAGFIGMHLCAALMERGHEVVGLDNYNDYYQVSLKRDRHAQLAKHKGFVGIEAELADQGAIENCFREHRFDVVCNLAAQAGVRYSLQNPQVYGTANVQGFINILEGCRRFGVRRLVYASSSSVYGGNQKLPFSETDPVNQPVSLYAATKRANELIAHSYAHLFDLQTIGLRFFTVYGPWGRPDMAMWLFVKAMLEGEAIKVFNHGRMQRDFTYIDDIIRGVVASIESNALDTYELLNIGNHRSEELMRLIEVIAEALHITPKLDLLPMQPGDVPATYADIERIRAKLGFSPTTSIEDGVPRFVRWYRAYHGV